MFPILQAIKCYTNPCVSYDPFLTKKKIQLRIIFYKFFLGKGNKPKHMPTCKACSPIFWFFSVKLLPMTFTKVMEFKNFISYILLSNVNVERIVISYATSQSHCLCNNSADSLKPSFVLQYMLKYMLLVHMHHQHLDSQRWRFQKWKINEKVKEIPLFLCILIYEKKRLFSLPSYFH